MLAYQTSLLSFVHQTCDPASCYLTGVLAQSRCLSSPAACHWLPSRILLVLGPVKLISCPASQLSGVAHALVLQQESLGRDSLLLVQQEPSCLVPREATLHTLTSHNTPQCGCHNNVRDLTILPSSTCCQHVVHAQALSSLRKH